MRRLVACATVLFVLAIAGTARAGTYIVQACGDAGINNSWGLTSLPFGVMEGNVECDSLDPMSGIWVRDILASAVDLGDGQSGWLEFESPAGTTISAVTLSRTSWKVAIDDLRPELRTAEGVVLETCSIADGEDRCSLDGPVTHANLQTTALRAGVRCDIDDPIFTMCPGGGTQHGYGFAIQEAAVTITDAQAPAAPTLAASGLWSGAEWYRGSSSITISASDASGIRGVRIYDEGDLLIEAPYTCNWTEPRPCDDAAAQQVELDTTTLADGEHVLGVAAVDAAGNESAHATKAVTIANEAPTAPELALTPSQATTGQFEASWTLPAHLVPIALAHVTICHLGSCSNTSTTATSMMITAPGLGTTTVSVYLEDVGGAANPDSAASANFVLEPVPPPPDDPPPPDPPEDPPPVDPTRLPTVDPRSTGTRQPRARAALRVRVARHAHRSKVVVLVRLDRRAAGRIRVMTRWHSGHRWVQPRTHWRVIRAGRARVEVPWPPSATRLQVVVRYRGGTHVRRASLRRIVRVA